MKLLFLRGQVPQDRSPSEIKHPSLALEDDVWTHLAARLGDERCEVVYWGGNRTAKYSDKCTIRWVKSLKHYECDFQPDVVWARGGFDEYRLVLKRYNSATKVYYGSGARYLPKDRIRYNLVLCDSYVQLRRLKEKGWEAELWIKPTVDSMFHPIPMPKKYDVGYVGDARYAFRARIKGISLAYTVPKDMNMLHLGWSGSYKVPKNVKVKRVKRWEMAQQICKCKAIVVPYKSYDSCPRIIPEALACGVPVVALDSVHFWYDMYPVTRTDKKNLWDAVRSVAGENPRNIYKNRLSMDCAVEMLRKHLERFKD